MRSATLILPFMAIGCLWAGPSWAQTAPVAQSTSVETVTVTGTKLTPEQVIHNFIASYAAPTMVLGKIARWKDGLCPKVLGLQPAAKDFIEKRVRDVAASVGARVNAKPDCPGNVEIVFTPQPQILLNEIRKKSPALLGFHWNSPSMADRMAVVSHPVQAWYATQTEDYLGNIHRNELATAAVSSFYGADGLKSQFFNVLIVADVDKIGSFSVSALADYATMLALSQTQAFDSCKDLPSISNLMAPGCDASVVATTLTDTDLSYLRALYKIGPDSQKYSAEKAIATQMEKTPAGQ